MILRLLWMGCSLTDEEMLIDLRSTSKVDVSGQHAKGRPDDVSVLSRLCKVAQHSSR